MAATLRGLQLSQLGHSIHNAATVAQCTKEPFVRALAKRSSSAPFRPSKLHLSNPTPLKEHRSVADSRQGRVLSDRKHGCKVFASAAGALPSSQKGTGGGAWLEKLTGANSPPLSDIVWSTLGAFACMAALAYLDKHLISRGLTPLTIGPTAAIAAILTASPKAPVAAKWNIIVAHMGAAATGIAALALCGPGWLSRAVAVAASVAFMQFTGSLHPPAAGLGLLFVDSAKHQSLGWSYILFPGLAAALVLVVVTEAVFFLRRSFQF